MDYLVIPAVACIASLLTFFSGFGLGTILTPAFLIFFSIEEAIALTGIVHFLNNIFKMSLTIKNINREVTLLFALPAMLASYVGARMLLYLGKIEAIYSYELFNKTFYISPMKLIIAVVLIFFALFEVLPRLKKIEFDKNKLVVGGLLSGFFGGLSGNQGALRSAFLMRFNLSKETFIATGIAIACMIDITRLSVYFYGAVPVNWVQNQWLLLVTVLAAFLGAYLGNKLLKKVTLLAVQNIVTAMVFTIAILLALGIL